MKSDKDGTERHFSVMRLIFPVMVVILGVGGMKFMAAHRKPPAEAAVHENALPVKIQVAVIADYDSVLEGFGKVSVLHESGVAPEVSGKVVAISSRLKVGEVFEKGEELFQIDSRDYESVLKSGEAQLKRGQRQVERLQAQLELNRGRFKTLELMTKLAKQEFDRVSKLYTEDKVGTQAGVEQAERAYAQAQDQFAVLKNQTDLLPHQIDEAKAALAATEAELKRMRLNLERCSVKAPFRGRIKRADVYVGDVVSPGRSVLVLADDSQLEISVPLDALSARKLMRFEKDGGSWFSSPEKVACDVRWSGGGDYSWTGRVERVEGLKAETRSLYIAVRVAGEVARAVPDGVLPLAEGMFCSVKMPGKTIKSVVRLPRIAVSMDSRVYIDNKGRLETRKVNVAWRDRDYAYIDKGITAGERVIVTRLIAPPENSLLNVIKEKGAR
jgi:RND family efflux transporter MFP subunit